jgi:hypothetical protein
MSLIFLIGGLLPALIVPKLMRDQIRGHHRSHFEFVLIRQGN